MCRAGVCGGGASGGGLEGDVGGIVGEGTGGWRCTWAGLVCYDGHV